MSGSSPEPADQEEMLLPFPPTTPPPPDPVRSPEPTAPPKSALAEPPPLTSTPPLQTELDGLPPLPDPAAVQPMRPLPQRGRRTASGAPPAPDPKHWADEALRLVRLGQPEVIGDWARTADLLTRRLQEEVARLAETTTGSTTEMQRAMETIAGSVSELRQTLVETMQRVETATQAHAKVLRDTVTEQGDILVARTREAASHIAVARHELSLAVRALKQGTLRHAVLMGAGTALLILILARILFPFWGMTRTDVEAWSRGTRLLQTYETAPAPERNAILRALEWREMPGSAPRSASSARPADGRSSTPRPDAPAR